VEKTRRVKFEKVQKRDSFATLVKGEGVGEKRKIGKAGDHLDQLPLQEKAGQKKSSTYGVNCEGVRQGRGT